jgi:hypothetical protein
MKYQRHKNNYLYEGLDYSASHSMMLWESAGFKLKEAALTADQIQQIFQNVEQGATAAGGNRTVLGKGKDAAVAVNKAWEDLKTKVQNSGPIKAVDQKYDDAVAKIEAGLGGPDNAISKVIMGYRKFAKEYPIAQSLIYGALIAAAGISGAGLGGAAVLGLLKMTDKLLQGEKFSSAAYSGAKTGAMAYGASKVGDLIKGKPDPIDAQMAKGLPNKIPLDPNDPDVAAFNRDWQDTIDASNKLPGGSGTLVGGEVASKSIGGALNAGKDYVAQGGGTDYASLSKAADAYYDQLDAMGVGADKANQLVSAFRTAAEGEAAKALGGKAISTAGGAFQSMTNSIERTGKKLSEGQVYMVFNRVCAQQQLNEGPMDFIKGAAAKGMDKLKTVGKNLTTKVTADKLNSAWKKAGSPMDSEEVAKILTAAGVGDDVVKQVYTDLKISAAPAAQASASSYVEIKKSISQLNTKDRQRMIAYLTKQIGTA